MDVSIILNLALLVILSVLLKITVLLRQVNYSVVEFRLILLLSILHGFSANILQIYYGARSRVSSASTLPLPSLEAGDERLS